jgi:hypothetical protein
LFSIGFQTVNAILPVRTAGLDVGVAVGLGVLVGLGVDVGPLRVAVGVLVGVFVARAVVVALAVAVCRRIGVHVGVGVAVAVVGVVPGTGMMRTCPGRIKAGLLMLFAAEIALTLTPKRIAISERVSPLLTV